MSELNAVSVAPEAQSPPPFVPSQSGAAAPTANEEAMLRSMFQEAAQKGLELNDVVPLPQAAPAPAQTIPVIPIPAKFQNPDGTVDEDKLKASSRQLDEVIEQKEKTIDELLADYKERERKLGQLGQQKAEIERQMPAIAPAPQPQIPQDLKAVEQRIREDYARDPVNTSIQLAEALMQKKLEPFMARFHQDEEMRRDTQTRDNLAKLAQSDPRILDPRLYAVVNQVLDEDPGMRNLKNPHKAAWNEVKERLRLGEPSQAPAQPSTATPTLGRGAPPSVSTLPGPMTPQTAYQQATTLNPFSPEGKAYEEKLKEMTRNLWQ